MDNGMVLTYDGTELGTLSVVELAPQPVDGAVQLSACAVQFTPSAALLALLNPAPVPSASPPVEPAPVAPPSAPSAPSAPLAQNAAFGQPPLSPQGNGAHVVIATVTTSAGVAWTAEAHVGDDPTSPAVYCAFVDGNGNAHPGLTLWAYADGCDIGATRADNHYDYVNNKLNVTYDGASVPVTSTNGKGTFDFWRGCRQQTIRYGKQAAWSAGAIDRTLLPNYAPGAQGPFDDSRYQYGYNALGLATYPAMGSTGDRGDIGYLPVWATAFVTAPTPDTYAVMRRADDNSGVWPCYFSDPATGGILDVTRWPNVTLLPSAQVAPSSNQIAQYLGAYDGATLTSAASTWTITGCPYTWDEAHETAYNFASAMVTGSARDRDHASFWANACLIAFNPDYRQVSGIAEHYQIRGTAWAIRSLFIAAYVSADTAYFADQLEAQRAFIQARPANSLGWYYEPTLSPAPGQLSEAIFEDQYLKFVLDAVWNKLPAWKPVADQLCALEPNALLIDGKPSPQYPLATQYWLVVENNGAPVQTFNETLALTLPHAGWSAAEVSSIMNPANSVEDTYNQIVAHCKSVGSVWQGKFADGYSDMVQYPYAAGSYPDILRAAVICGVNAGVDGAQTCMSIMDNLPTKPNWSADYRFHIVPRVAGE